MEDDSECSSDLEQKKLKERLNFTPYCIKLQLEAYNKILIILTKNIYKSVSQKTKILIYKFVYLTRWSSNSS